MEGDDEWEDHLIVSYTPPQGCEMTMTEFERLKANTKLEIFRIHNDMTPEELEAIPAECSKTVAVCREAAAKLVAESKYLYFLGPSSTPGEYWAGVGNDAYKLSGNTGGSFQQVYQAANCQRYILEWKDSIVIAPFSVKPLILNKTYTEVRSLEKRFGGFAQKSLGATSDGSLLYLAENKELIGVSTDYRETVQAPEVKHFEWDERNHKIIILQENGHLRIIGQETKVDLCRWLHTSEETPNAFLLQTNETGVPDNKPTSYKTFRKLRGSDTVLLLLDNCQLCLLSARTLLPLHLSCRPKKMDLTAILQMGLCKPVRGVEMVLCAAQKEVVVAAVFQQKVHQLIDGEVHCTPWAFVWLRGHPVTFGMGGMSLLRIVTKRV